MRGHAFAARVPGAADPTPGQLARLVREPANPADRYAVSVWIAGATGKWRIGYLDRSVAARIAPRLDRGARIAAKIDGWTAEPDGRWQRPLVVLLPSDEQATRSARVQVEPPREATPVAAERKAGSHAPARSISTAATSASASPAVGANKGSTPTAPGLWGRPPGVSRRVVRDKVSAPGRDRGIG